MYALLLYLTQDARLQVGAIGQFLFPSGAYLYVGSARGPGGMLARVQRHLRHDSQRRHHWHIDRLLSIGNVREAWWHQTRMIIECTWAETIAEAGTLFPPRFGASDCRCPGHLIFLDDHRGVNAAWERSTQLMQGGVHRLQFKSQ